ncbi:MAG: hypothetical protein KF869_00770 [Phycisphaeraceae bacterium]|nr:hypothetical protein [Phycisphaeraceae bacterium]
MSRMRSFVLPSTVALCAAMAAADGTYQFTLNSQQSELTTAINITAPSTGSLIGNYDAETNPTGTRTKPGFLGTFGDTENVPVPLTVTVVVNGNNTTNPSGAFVLRLDPDTGEAGLSGLSLDLLGGDDIAVNLTANMLWNTFRTRNPTCTVFGGFTIPVPLGQAVVSTLTAQQGAGEAIGTLVESVPGTYVVTIPVTLSVALGAVFLDTEVPPTPQDVPLVFAAEVMVSGSSATISIELEGFDTQQQQEGPIGDPFSVPFAEPLCGGSLIFNLQLQSLSSSSSVSGQLLAAGDKQAAPACPCDWDGNGEVGVPDIFAFLTSWFAGNGDFDGVNGTQVADIFAFLNCWFSRPAPC